MLFFSLIFMSMDINISHLLFPSVSRHLQMHLYIFASIIVIAFFLVFHSILFTANKSTKLCCHILYVSSVLHIITLILKSLHWLPIKYRLNFELRCINHRALSLGYLFILTLIDNSQIISIFSLFFLF